MTELQCGELFSGAGGLALGLLLANDPKYKIVHNWAMDYDSDACETYAYNVSSNVIHEDIRFTDFAQLNRVDILAFGFPCNDFNSAGKRLGINGEFGGLYRYCVDALNVLKPPIFIAENVRGLTWIDGGETIKTILSDFMNCGYEVTVHLYDLSKYGIPQTRQRIIFVGMRDDSYRVPSPKPYEYLNVSSKYALECPPIAENAYNHTYVNHNETVINRISYIGQGKTDHNSPDIPDELRIKYTSTESKDYYRLHADKPAYTVQASARQNVCHYEQNRLLTLREYARLQTFPDNFKFFGTKKSVKRQIGNAVPPKFAKIIGESVLHTLSGTPYDSLYN